MKRNQGPCINPGSKETVIKLFANHTYLSTELDTLDCCSSTLGFKRGH